MPLQGLCKKPTPDSVSTAAGPFVFLFYFILCILLLLRTGNMLLLSTSGQFITSGNTGISPKKNYLTEPGLYD